MVGVVEGEELDFIYSACGFELGVVTFFGEDRDDEA